MLRQASLPHQALFARGLAMARISRLLLVVGVLTWPAAWAQAQWRPQPHLPEVPVSKTGTIESVSGLMIQVTTEDNQSWVLTVRPNAKVKITGKGNANSLAPGQTVSFSATISGKKITEKVSKIAVVTPPDQMPMAVGMAPNPGPEPKQPKSKVGKNAGADVGDSSGPSEITGEVVKAMKNRVSLKVNGKKQMIELADDVEVTFDLDGPAALASVNPGAKIEFKGKGQGNFPRAVVDDVKVEVVPAEAHSGKHVGKKPLHAKSKKSGDDSLDATGTDDEKPQPKKPARKTHKKPEKTDDDTGDAKPAGGDDTPAKDK
jgi:hypothetical protein